MGLLLAIIFYSSFAILAYTFFVYPVILWLFSKRGSIPDKREGELPFVSVLIPVYNEETVIEQKLNNCLALDYPEGKLEIVVASDGSTDQTMEIIRQFDDGRITVFDYEENAGKATIINKCIPRLKGEIVVLTDASGMLSPNVLRSMIPCFQDPSIGVVCGIYHVIEEGRTGYDSAEHTYHGMEMQLRLWEGLFRTTLSGTGALLALRKTDYVPLPPEAINEDYIIPARIAIMGRRVIYDGQACIHDCISTTLKQVFRRRVRIAYGNWQQLRYLRPLLNPFNFYLFWVFLSHKLLRMAMPFMLVLLVLSSFAISPVLFFLMMGGGLLLLGLGVTGLAMDKYIKERNPLSCVALLFLNCLAVFLGTFRFFAGMKVKW